MAKGALLRGDTVVKPSLVRRGDSPPEIPGDRERKTVQNKESAELVLACCEDAVESSLPDQPILRLRSGFERLPTVRDGEVYVVDGSAYFSRPGPQNIDSLVIFGKVLHPKRFEALRGSVPIVVAYASGDSSSISASRLSLQAISNVSRCSSVSSTPYIMCEVAAAVLAAFRASIHTPTSSLDHPTRLGESCTRCGKRPPFSSRHMVVRLRPVSSLICFALRIESGMARPRSL